MEDEERNNLLNNFRLWLPGWPNRDIMKSMDKCEAEKKFACKIKLISDLDSLIESEGFNLSRLDELLDEWISVGLLYANYQLKLIKRKSREGRERNTPWEERVLVKYENSGIKISSEANRIVEPLYYKLLEKGYTHFELTG